MSDLDSLQTTLAAEHAAVYVYGVLGGRTPPTTSPALYAAIGAAYAAHRGRRDVLVRRISDLDAEPVAAAATYDVAGPLTTPAQLQTTALGVERACATTYSSLVAGTTTTWRRWAVAALRDAALRELTFGGTPEPLPGIPS